MKTSIAVLLVSLMPGFALAQGAAPGGGAQPPPPPAPKGAKIISIQGPVQKFGACGAANKPLAVGDILLNGCQLTATDPGTTLQIECTNGATLQPLSGGFVVAINGTGVPSCILKLKSGSAMATSSGVENEEGSASIETGALGAVVKHTSVVVTVPASGAANAEACVIDGEATVTRGGETINLVAGKMAYASSKAVVPIPDTRLRWVANNLAVATTTGAGVQVPRRRSPDCPDRYLAVYSLDRKGNWRPARAHERPATVNAPDNSFHADIEKTAGLQLGGAAVDHVQPWFRRRPAAPSRLDNPRRRRPFRRGVPMNPVKSRQPTRRGSVRRCLFHWASMRQARRS